MIVRDIWAYQLSLSTLPLKPDSTKTPGEEGLGEEAKENEKDDEKSDDENSDKDDASKSDSSSEPGIDKDLLEEISERSSSSENDMTTAFNGGNGPKKSSRKPLRASDTLVCLVVGLWVIRYPVVNVEIERSASVQLTGELKLRSSLVNSISIPYIDFGRSTHLPEEMQRKINRDTMLALAPTVSRQVATPHEPMSNLPALPDTPLSAQPMPKTRSSLDFALQPQSSRDQPSPSRMAGHFNARRYPYYLRSSDSLDGIGRCEYLFVRYRPGQTDTNTTRTKDGHRRKDGDV